MQSNARPGKKQGVKFLDTRLFIAALSIAVTVGFWNLFSGEALSSQASADPNTTPPPDPDPAAAELNPADETVPGMPTIAPLVQVTIPTAPLTGAQDTLTSASPAGGGAPALREVAQPTVVVVQKQKPVVNAVEAPAQVSSGGKRTTRPVTRTRSSR